MNRRRFFQIAAGCQSGGDIVDWRAGGLARPIGCTASRVWLQSLCRCAGHAEHGLRLAERLSPDRTWPAIRQQMNILFRFSAKASDLADVTAFGQDIY